MANKKAIETYERRVERLEWYREVYHRHYRGRPDWFTSNWRDGQLEIIDRIERSGFDVPPYVGGVN